MRSHYWSCSKFAEKIRGIKKPTALTMTEWKKWKTQTRAKSPVRYWIAEEGLPLLQNIIMWIPDKIYSVKYYIINRWIDQTYALVAHSHHIKPGEYRDLDFRILHCLFDELVDFVEIEKAYCQVRWSDSKESKKYKWWQVGKWRTRTWRDASLGIAYLNWESTLTNEEFLNDNDKHLKKPTSQAIAAQEILELYNWWKYTRPARIDPMDASGWTDYCEDRRERNIGILEDDPDGEVDTKSMHTLMHNMEIQYNDEDTAMLIRLINIRNHLWT